MASFNLSDADKALGDLAKRYREAAMKGLISAGQRIVQSIQVEIIPNTYIDTVEGTRKAPPFDEGHYRAGWRSRVVGPIVEIFHINPKIAAIVEYGVRAENVKISRAMIVALTKWAFRKGIGGEVVTTAKGVVAKLRPKEASESIAWAIAKQMKKHGIEPRHVLKRAMLGAKGHVQREVNREIRRAMKSEG